MIKIYASRDIAYYYNFKGKTNFLIFSLRIQQMLTIYQLIKLIKTN